MPIESLSDPQFAGQLKNYKYWCSLKHVEIAHRQFKPTKADVELEIELDRLNREGKWHDMGLMIKKGCEEPVSFKSFTNDITSGLFTTETHSHSGNHYWYLDEKDQTPSKSERARVLLSKISTSLCDRELQPES